MSADLAAMARRYQLAGGQQEMMRPFAGDALLTSWRDVPDLLAEVETLRANPRDEYHTMDELYHYRMLYNAMAANWLPAEWTSKSWRHSDGEPCFGGGWFVVYLLLPTGQVSNHYKAEHWGLFDVAEVACAPEYDGHTPQVAAERMLAYLQSVTPADV